MDGENGIFMRVQVTIDVSIPLSCGRVISLGDEVRDWVSFKYERLPNICYWCSCLTHADKDCDFWLDSASTLSTESQQFGSWLQAALILPSKKTMISVSSFNDKMKEKATRPSLEVPLSLVAPTINSDDPPV